MKLLSIVVPMYNEREGAELFFATLMPVLDALAARFCLRWEIVAVDDGSSDGTDAILESWTTRDARIRAVLLARNFGKEAAMTAGIEHTCGDAVIPIDADLQDPPELINDMVAAWLKGAEVVVAVRTRRDDDTNTKRLSSGLFYKVFNALCKPGIPENAGDFRLMDRVVVQALLELRESNRFMKGLFAWVGFRTQTVGFIRPARSAGTTKWNYRKLWRFALDGITSFSTLPLTLCSWLGGVVSICAFAFGACVIVKTLLFGEAVQGYPTLLVAILFLGGVQLLGLGIIGEYVGRLYMESKRRPIYIARRIVGQAPSAQENEYTNTEQNSAPPKVPSSCKGQGLS